MRISDWSSDVCSSDLQVLRQRVAERNAERLELPGVFGADPALGQIGADNGQLALDRGIGFVRISGEMAFDPGSGLFEPFLLLGLEGKGIGRWHEASLTDQIVRASWRERVCKNG